MPENVTLRRPALAVLLALLFAAGMTYYHLGVFLPRSMERGAALGMGGGYSFGNDFYPIWLTSHDALQGERNPYSEETTARIQTGLFGRPLDGDDRLATDPPRDYRVFAYPAYVDLLFWPLALLPFPVVRIALTAVLAILTAMSLPLWLRALGLRAGPALSAVLILLTLSSYAALEGLFAGQVGLIVGFLLAATFAALVRGRFALAGSLFAFTLIKPQVSAVVTVYLLLWSVSRWRERRGFVYGFLGWSAVLGALSLVVWPRWTAEWLHVLEGYGNYAPPPLITYSLGPTLGPRVGIFLVVALLAAALMIMWRARGEAENSSAFTLTVSLLLALTSITLLPGQAVYDHVVLLPGILLAVFSWRSIADSRAFAVILGVGALALFWQWISAIPLLAVRFVIGPQRFLASGLLLIPFHAAASVPLAATAALGFMMWKDMRTRPRAPDAPAKPDSALSGHPV
jgi:hypothetical protein